MFKKFYPDYDVASAYQIPYEELYQKGVRGIIYDIDNTLVEHNQDATGEAVCLFRRLKGIGFSITLLSNNNKERVERFNRRLKVSYICKAGKPSPKSYRQAMERMHTNPSNTIFVGDQLFTDIWGAKRAGITSYLVEPIAKHEEIQIVLKRKLEKIVLHFYRKKKTKEA